MRAVAISFLSWKRYLEAKLQPCGVNLKQAALLRMIRSEGYLYPADVARRFFCDRPTATSLINTLVRRGWVKREADLADARRVRVIITDAGIAKLDSLPPDASRSAPQQRDPLAPFTEAERKVLIPLLQRLAAHLDKDSIK